ncbi:MAG TPA: helix-turn-helix domain-containing protein [Kofleriaceae bacterium]|nr:helix-turn-helix domain-containing protein [Kofleriaceae bacterium]
MGGKPRIRRTAEEAQSRILDAAEAQLRERGPDGLRLTELAAEVGVSHPAILHHFGSRTGLVKAVLVRITRRLEEQIVAELSGDVSAARGANLLDRVFTVLADRGHARMMAWLFLSGEPLRNPLMGSHLGTIAETVHRIRVQRHPEAAGDFEHTLFTVLLAALVPFGRAIAGDQLRRSAGLDADPDADRRFVIWLANVLHEQLER